MSVCRFLGTLSYHIPHSMVTDHGNDENKDIKQDDNEAEKCHESVDDVSINIDSQLEQQQQGEDNKANEQIANDTNEARDTIDKNLIKQQEVATKKSTSINEETLQMEEEQKLKKQKVSDLLKYKQKPSNRKYLFVCICYSLLKTTNTLTKS